MSRNLTRVPGRRFALWLAFGLNAIMLSGALLTDHIGFWILSICSSLAVLAIHHQPGSSTIPGGGFSEPPVRNGRRAGHAVAGKASPAALPLTGHPFFHPSASIPEWLRTGETVMRLADTRLKPAKP